MILINATRGTWARSLDTRYSGMVEGNNKKSELYQHRTTIHDDMTHSSIRNRWYLRLNEPSHEIPWAMGLTFFLAIAIVLNIIQSILGSLPAVNDKIGHILHISSYVFAVIFLTEYSLRVWAAAETPHELEMGDLRKRWLYVRSMMGMVDLLSFLPILLWLILPEDSEVDLRMLKLIAMVRVLKLTRYSGSLLILARVYHENRQTLLAAMLVMMIMMLIAATGIYFFERAAQPDAFGSIPDSMWWAFVTLTTVGYGDVTPITIGGKLFGSMVMVCGVGVAAMPAGIFASSFVQLIREQEKERRRHRRKQVLDMSEIDDQFDLNPHLDLSNSERVEVDYLINEFGLTLDQAIGVVKHFRH